MKLKEIHRTSTFAWCPITGPQTWLATGTVAGALDASFNNDSALEVWAPEFGDEGEFEMGREGGSGGPSAKVVSEAR